MTFCDTNSKHCLNTVSNEEYCQSTLIFWLRRYCYEAWSTLPAFKFSYELAMETIGAA